jgi:hypothetical protein
MTNQRIVLRLPCQRAYIAMNRHDLEFIKNNGTLPPPRA